MLSNTFKQICHCRQADAQDGQDVPAIFNCIFNAYKLRRVGRGYIVALVKHKYKLFREPA